MKKKNLIKTLSCAFLLITAFLSPQVFPQPPKPSLPAASPEKSKLKALRLRALQSIDRGNITEADSLLTIADSAGALEAADLVRWIQVKAALSRFADAGRLCCAAGRKEPVLAFYACGQLTEAIRTSPLMSSVRRSRSTAHAPLPQETATPPR